MYQPVFVCSSQDPRFAGATCISTAQPNSANGFALKSCKPCYTSNSGFALSTLEVRSRFSWCSAWQRILHHKPIGNILSVPQRTEMKWSLKTWIALSATFYRWSFGGTSWNFIWLVFITCLNSLDILLSKMCIFGSNPPSFSLSTNVWYVC